MDDRKVYRSDVFRVPSAAAVYLCAFRSGDTMTKRWFGINMGVVADVAAVDHRWSWSILRPDYH